MDQTHRLVLATGDAFSIGVLGAALVGWLPSIAAIWTIIYYTIRMYESPTVQGWIKKWRG